MIETILGLAAIGLFTVSGVIGYLAVTLYQQLRAYYTTDKRKAT